MARSRQSGHDKLIEEYEAMQLRDPSEVERAIWKYRAGFGYGALVRALRNRNLGEGLSAEDCFLVADFIAAGKLPKGQTLATAQAKTFLLRVAALEVGHLKEQWRNERGRPKRGDTAKAIDEVVASLIKHYQQSPLLTQPPERAEAFKARLEDFMRKPKSKRLKNFAFDLMDDPYFW